MLWLINAVSIVVASALCSVTYTRIVVIILQVRTVYKS